MTFNYTLKTRADVTEADLPFIESPFFARERVRSAYRHGTLKLHLFLYRRVTPFTSYGEKELLRDVDAGEVFAVRRGGDKPLQPLITKVADQSAPNGYRWDVNQYALSSAAFPLRSKLHYLLHFEIPQRQRRQTRTRASATEETPQRSAGAGASDTKKVSTLFLQLEYPPGVNDNSRYTLRGAKGFQAEKTVKDDKIVGNDTLDFEFTEVPMDDTYELIVTTDQEEIVLFRDIEFGDIRRQVIR